MKPLQISAETAIKLSEKLNVPIENLMHMPQHILMKKLAELAQQEQEQSQPITNEKQDSSSDGTGEAPE